MQSQTDATSRRVCPRGASFYEWQSGDSLQSVALTNEVTAQAITLMNPNVDFTALKAGDEICIPPQVLTCLSGTIYQVAGGDTFQSIAERFGISTLELAERNPGVKEGELQIGQVLCVPSATSGTTPSTPSQPDNSTGGSSAGSSETTGSTGGTTAGFSCPIGYEARTVKAGQSYADLLVENNVSYRAMRLTNPTLVPGRLTTGMRYCAPPAGTRQLCSHGGRYTIQAGENLTDVARRFNVTPGRMMQLNPTLLPTDFSSGTVICTP